MLLQFPTLFNQQNINKNALIPQNMLPWGVFAEHCSCMFAE